MGTSNTVIFYRLTYLQIKGFAYSDFGGDRDGQKSTTWYTFTLVGEVVSWTSKLQLVFALSTSEAEYVVEIEANKDEIWI